MGALTQKSPIDVSSSFGINPPTQGQAPLEQLPQPGQSGAAQSALMQGLTNYFKGQTAAAGNPNATPPSMSSSLMQSAGNQFDNSQAGGLLNSMAGNSATNGFGAKYGGGATAAGGAGMTDADGASAAGSTSADGAAAGGASTDGAASMLDSI